MNWSGGFLVGGVSLIIVAVVAMANAATREIPIERNWKILLFVGIALLVWGFVLMRPN